MQFRIATTFTSSLAKLSSSEQTAVKTTVFDLQTDPMRPKRLNRDLLRFIERQTS